MYLKKSLWTLFFYFAVNIKTQSGSLFLNQLTKYINKDLKIYQVMIVTDQKSRNSSVGRIIETLSKNVQTGKVINDLSIAPTFQLEESLRNPRDTTFFVGIHSLETNSNLSQVDNFLNFVIRVSTTRRRPKCLIILLQKKRYTYEDFLRYLWSKQILDVSIVEIDEDERMDPFPKVELNTTIHYFNPFTNEYIKKEFSIGSTIFPNKLRDLHDYSLKAAVINFYPTSNVTHNSTGYPISFKGSDRLIIDALAKSMHFTLETPATDGKSYGYLICGKDFQVDGFQYNISHNQVQMFSVHGDMLDLCEPYRLETTRSTGRSTLVALVPLVVDKTYSYVIDWKFLVLILTALLIGLIMMLSCILNFEKRIWNYLNLIQVLLGVSIPEQPQKLVERIIFGCLIIVCIFYSNVIYTMTVDLILTTESERKLESFKDLAKSGLEIQTGDFLFRQLTRFNDGIAKKLLNDSVKFSDPFGVKKCIEILVNHKNVSCVMHDNLAKMAIENHRDECGRPSMKMLKDVFAETVTSMPLEPNSPYVKRFDGILIKLQEGGFFQKWREYLQRRYKPGNISCDERKSDPMVLILLLSSIIIVGFSLSAIAFIGELLVSKL